MACIQGMRDVVALLISKGADSKLVDAEGKTRKLHIFNHLLNKPRAG